MEKLTKKTISRIALTLENEEEVLINLVKLADFLEVSTSTKLTSCSVEKKTAYECIQNILSDWVARVGNKPTVKVLQEKLREMKIFKSADMLDPEELLSKPPAKYLRLNILKHVTDFKGRKAELKKLKEWYKAQGSKAIKPVAVISGMGGQGKTELARKFIHTFSPRRHCCWLESSDIKVFNNSLNKLGSAIRLKNEEEGYTSRTFRNELNMSEMKQWLLIADNMDSVFEGFENFVDEATANGALFVITSRSTEIFPGEREHIPLGTLPMEDAKKLLSLHLDNDQEDDQENLCNILGNHVLALRQAASYIKSRRELQDTKFTVQDFIKQFKAESLNNPLKLTCNLYKNTFYNVVKLSITSGLSSSLSCSQCVKIALTILAMVRPEGIDTQDFQEIFGIFPHSTLAHGNDEDCPLLVNEVITTLSTKICLVRREGDRFVCHRLVQAVVLDILFAMEGNWILEKVIDYYFLELDKNGFRNSLRLHLEKVWLSILDLRVIAKHSSFPIKLLRSGPLPDNKGFLMECLQQAKKLRRDDMGLFDLKILHYFVEISQGTPRNEKALHLSKIVSEIQENIKHGNCIGPLVVSLFFEDRFVRCCPHGEIEAVLRFMISKKEIPLTLFKLKFFLMRNLYLQEKFEEVARTCVNLEQDKEFFSSYFTKSELDQILCFLWDVSDNLSFGEGLCDFKSEAHSQQIQCAKLLCDVVLGQIKRFNLHLTSYIIYGLARFLCKVFDVTTVVEKMNTVSSATTYLVLKSEEVEGTNKRIAKLVHAVAVHLNAEGSATESKTLLNTLLKQQQEVLQPNHLNCYETKCVLGRVLTSQGKLAEGFSLLEKGAGFFGENITRLKWRCLKRLASFMLSYGVTSSDTSYEKNIKAKFLAKCKQIFSVLQSNYFTCYTTDNEVIEQCKRDLETYSDHLDENVRNRLFEKALKIGQPLDLLFFKGNEWLNKIGDTNISPYELQNPNDEDVSSLGWLFRIDDED